MRLLFVLIAAFQLSFTHPVLAAKAPRRDGKAEIELRISELASEDLKTQASAYQFLSDNVQRLGPHSAGLGKLFRENVNGQASKHAAALLERLAVLAEPAVLELVAILRDARRSDRLIACKALGKIGPAAGRATGDLAALVANDKVDSELRVAAAGALAAIRIFDDETIESLRSVAANDEFSLAQEAVIALHVAGRQASPASSDICRFVARSADEALKSNYPKKMATAVRAVATSGSDAKVAVPALLPYIDWELPPNATIVHRELKTSAIETLGELGPEARPAIPSLNRALRSPHAWVRATAAHALFRISGDASQVLPSLQDLLRERSPIAQRAALYAIADIGTAAKSLIPAIRESSFIGPPRVTAEETLVTLGDSTPLAGRPAGYLDYSWQEQVLQAASFASSAPTHLWMSSLDRMEYLKRWGRAGRPALPWVLHQLQSENKLLRRQAIQTVGRIAGDDDHGLAVLREAVADNDWRVRQLASIALRPPSPPLPESLEPGDSHPVIVKSDDAVLSVGPLKVLRLRLGQRLLSSGNVDGRHLVQVSAGNRGSLWGFVNESDVTSFSAWQSEYQREFERRAELRQFPLAVEGRVIDGRNQYRAAFGTQDPNVAEVLSSHGLERRIFDSHRIQRAKQGFELLTLSSFVAGSGSERYQATWIKRGSHNAVRQPLLPLERQIPDFFKLIDKNGDSKIAIDELKVEEEVFGLLKERQIQHVASAGLRELEKKLREAIAPRDQAIESRKQLESDQETASTVHDPTLATGVATLTGTGTPRVYKVEIESGRVIGGTVRERGADEVAGDVVGGWYQHPRMTLITQMRGNDVRHPKFMEMLQLSSDGDTWLLRHRLAGFAQRSVPPSSEETGRFTFSMSPRKPVIAHEVSSFQVSTSQPPLRGEKQVTIRQNKGTLSYRFWHLNGRVHRGLVFHAGSGRVRGEIAGGWYANGLVVLAIQDRGHAIENRWFSHVIQLQKRGDSLRLSSALSGFGKADDYTTYRDHVFDPDATISRPVTDEQRTQLEALAEKYRLNDGAALRHFRPTYPGSRKSFLDLAYKSRSKNVTTLFMHWDGRRLTIQGARMMFPSKAYEKTFDATKTGLSVEDIVRNITNVPRSFLRAPDDLLRKKIIGDFVWDPSASEDRVLTDLSRLLSEEIGVPVTVGFNVTPIRTIVCRNRNVDEGQSVFGKRLQISGLDARWGIAQRKGSWMSFTSFLSRVMGNPVVDETSGLGQKQVSWKHEGRTSAPSEKKKEAILRSITEQSGVSFGFELRDVRVLELSTNPANQQTDNN
jgi:hypothetical protein